VTSCGTGRAVHDSFTAPATPAIACVSDAATYEPPVVSASVLSVDSSKCRRHLEAADLDGGAGRRADPHGRDMNARR